MAKEIKFDSAAWKAIEAGVDKIANVVKITLGPRGQNVVLGKSYGSPVITNDGVTIAKEIELEDPFENMGAQLVKEVASKTNDIAGDGTTTATLLAQVIFKQGLKNIVAGANAMVLKRGMEKAVEEAVSYIKSLAIPVEQTKESIANVASISANNDNEIGMLIAEAIEKIGKDGVITVEESKGIETSLDVVQGMQFDKGYSSSYFVNNKENMTVDYNDAFLLLTDKRISAIKDILPLLEKVAKAGRPLVIIAEDVEGEALATLVVNTIRGTIKVVAVKAPGFGDRRKEMLEDIAVLTGGEVVTDVKGLTLETMEITSLGRAKAVKISKDSTTIVEGAGDKSLLDARILQVKAEIENSDSEYDREKLQERLARMAGGVAVIKAGAATETELKEKKLRIEDALSATRAAIEEGIVAGGGMALLKAAKVVQDFAYTLTIADEKVGAMIIAESLSAPLKQIAHNAGQEGAVIAKEVLNHPKGLGFNAMTLEYQDLIAAGVVDPVKVTRSALQNAASIAAMLLTTGALVADKPLEKNQGGQIPPNSGMM